MLTRERPIDYDAFVALGHAVVQQAVIDWQTASLALAHTDTATHEMLGLKREVERFFTSKAFDLYSDMDGRTLLRKLKGMKI